MDLYDQVMEAGKLLVSTDPNYAPQSFLDEAGELDGFDIDVAKEVASRLGVEVEFVTPDWDMITPGGWAGRWDLSIGSMTPTEERSEVLWFTSPYYYTPAVFAVHKDNTDIRTVADLSGKALGLGTATTYEAWLNDTLSIMGGEIMYDPPSGVDIKPYSTDSEAVQELALGDGVRLDAVMTAAPTVQEAIDSGIPLKYVGTPAFYEPLVFALDKSRGTSDKMLAALNDILTEMHSDGTLTEFSLEWYGVDITSLVVPGEEATLGSEEMPIKVLFVPSVDVDFMIESGALIEQALADATGLVFEVSVPTSYAATIEEMCASPTDIVGFIPAMGYALANSLCGVEPGLASVRYGWNVYWTAFYVARDSDFQTLEDLEGTTWAYPSATSTSGFLYPTAIWDDLGITFGETVEAGGHPQSVKAVYNGEADVGSAYYSAPLLPEGNWTTDMPPDIPDEFVPDCAVNEDDKLYCGEYRILDARAAIRGEAPDVVQKVRILALSAEIPNDTMSFSPEFPDELRQVIMDAVVEYVASEACLETLCNESFYDWTDAAPIFDENFDGVRLLMEAQGINLENIGE
jgi:phosphate/phosphite/phosphonate ABC transporter binding protein